MQSILKFIRQAMLGNEDVDAFDVNLIMDINTAFLTLTQIGIGPPDGFYITDATATWDDFLDESDKSIGAVQTYVQLTVKLLFDPPANSALIESINRELAKLEWRLNHDAEITQQGGIDQNGK